MEGLVHPAPGSPLVPSLYSVLHVVRLEFGDLAKSHMCFGDWAKSQTVQHIRVRYRIDPALVPSL